MRNGVGAEKDEAIGLYLIRAAAEVGNPSGINKLAVLFEEGRLPDGKVDERRAAELYAESAAAGSVLGRFYLGWALFFGVGVAQDEAQAIVHWEEAAKRAPEEGAEEAAYQLWEEHVREQARATGRRKKDVPPDSWLKLAAELEHPPAVADLARWTRAQRKRR